MLVLRESTLPVPGRNATRLEMSRAHISSTRKRRTHVQRTTHDYIETLTYHSICRADARADPRAYARTDPRTDPRTNPRAYPRTDTGYPCLLIRPERCNDTGLVIDADERACSHHVHHQCATYQQCVHQCAPGNHRTVM